ncbi:hypothetical protein BIT28_04485 [Photobacterium proteolyticum]|uniref:TadE-like domain-containing protein n=1 Tax=Photobacterium proteolyticum TaxID=1903952 RepID=A0A1Q9H1N6_9GAMM|nr:TadE family protein [Photobacterium proteolyticum]OLQ81644.1 hypothetical protein BIT28_04485 [Photobacterium proteolyticum]
MRIVRGSVTVETALGLPVLLMMLLTFVELCFMTFAVTSADYALAAAVAETKRTNTANEEQTEAFKNQVMVSLNNNTFNLLMNRTVESTYNADVLFIDNLDDLRECSENHSDIETCSGISSDAYNKPIAIYRLEYDYTPSLSFILPSISIKKEIIAIQESQRCKYKYGGSCE